MHDLQQYSISLWLFIEYIDHRVWISWIPVKPDARCVQSWSVTWVPWNYWKLNIRRLHRKYIIFVPLRKFGSTNLISEKVLRELLLIGTYQRARDPSNFFNDKINRKILLAILDIRSRVRCQSINLVGRY